MHATRRFPKPPTHPRTHPPTIDKTLHLKSDAAIRIAEVAAPHPALGGAFEKAARLLLPQNVRDGACKFITHPPTYLPTYPPTYLPTHR